MKKFLKVFALMAVLLTGCVVADASVTLTYDFMTNHPSSTIRIDQGYKIERDGKVYWGGQWAGLFGNKIAFDPVSAYPSLRAQGGLCDYHDHQKMYVMNLNSGDKVTFYYTGTNAALQYHVSSTCTMAALTANFDPITSGVAYTVNGSGDLCVLNKWKKNEAETIITRIVIESVKEYETIDVSNGLSTFCSTVPLDFSSTSNVKAFIATGYDNGKFTFQQVKYVPSNTGFLAVSQGGSATSVSVPVGRSSDYHENVISGNLFIGCLKQTSVSVNNQEKYYVFGKAYGYIAVYLMWWDFNCAAKKAYIAVPK